VEKQKRAHNKYKHLYTCLLTLALAGWAVLITPFYASAGGFAVYTHGARELARGNSVVASPEGPTSSFFNPATLSELKGNQVETGVVLIAPSKEFTSSTSGLTTESESNLGTPFTLFSAWHINDRFTAGLGINNPFGLGNEWPSAWEGRYLSTEGEMQSFLVNPSMAWRVTDRFTMAAGVDFLTADIRLENKFPLGPIDGNRKFEADGDAWGFNLGLLYKITNRISFGLSYRSGFDLEVEGDIEFTPQVPPILNNTTGHGEINLPAQAFAGLAFQVTDSFVFEIGCRWEEWSCYEDLTLFFDTPVAGKTMSVVAKNWGDNYAFNAGGKYRIDEGLDLLFGYLYDGSPVNDETFEPSISDAQKHLLSLGVSKSFKNLTGSLTYAYQRYKGRDKNNAIATSNGSYSQQTHMAAISLAYTF